MKQTHRHKATKSGKAMSTLQANPRPEIKTHALFFYLVTIFPIREMANKARAKTYESGLYGQDSRQMLGVARATGSQIIAQSPITIFCSGIIFFVPEQIFCIATTIKKLF